MRVGHMLKKKQRCYLSVIEAQQHTMIYWSALRNSRITILMWCHQKGDVASEQRLLERVQLIPQLGKVSKSELCGYHDEGTSAEKANTLRGKHTQTATKWWRWSSKITTLQQWTAWWPMMFMEISKFWQPHVKLFGCCALPGNLFWALD